MMMTRHVPLILRVLAGGALVTVAVLWAGTGPAAASAAAPCTPIVILQPLCPKTTTPSTMAPPTTAPPTTKAPTTTRPSSSAATATKKTAAQSTSGRATSVGDGSPSVPAAGAIVLPSLGSGADAVAPQLAAPSTTTALAGVPEVQPEQSVLTSVKGLPNDHATARIILSLLTVLVAALALAQLPASRRTPQPDGDPLV
jgi:hypothetical protein